MSTAQPYTIQAIHTRVLPATNSKGTRIVASAARGRIIMSLEGASATDKQHMIACQLLKDKFIKEDAPRYGTDPAKNPWGRETIAGTLPDGSIAHVYRVEA